MTCAKFVLKFVLKVDCTYVAYKNTYTEFCAVLFQFLNLFQF